MPTSQLAKVVQKLHGAVLRRDGAGLTDGRLLDFFISNGDEAAFEALVRRHGPMVWGVCRRVLQNHHDADDAFQATFLVLVRKATAVVPRDMVGNWLYGVAQRTARKAKAVAARRHLRESQARKLPEIAFVQKEAGDDDLPPLLDQELKRLPTKYRAVIVLCDLEGKTRKEAARQLGWPEGTIAGRLARARSMLAKRLQRRGLAMPVGALASALSPQTATASAPTSVVITTIKAAKVYLAGHAASGLISAEVAFLMEGVMKAMFLTKLKTVMMVLLIVGVASSMGGLLSWRTTAAAQTGNQPASKSPREQTPGQPVTDKAPKGEPEPTPINGANRFADLLKDLDLEIPRVMAKIPKAPASYQFHFHKIEVAANGAKRADMGSGMAREGDKIYLGPVGVRSGPASRGPGGLREDDNIPLEGIAFSAGVNRLKDGRLRLDVLVERFEKKETGRIELRVAGTSVRIIKIVRLEETVDLELEGTGKRDSRTRFQVTIRAGSAPFGGYPGTLGAGPAPAEDVDDGDD
jgi:RNA polymerase sigma factor (sigma-70 family)